MWTECEHKVQTGEHSLTRCLLICAKACGSALAKSWRICACASTRYFLVVVVVVGFFAPAAGLSPDAADATDVLAGVFVACSMPLATQAAFAILQEVRL